MTRYDFAGWADDIDGVRTLIINGVPGYDSRRGPDWFTAVGGALGDNAIPPDMLILDHRLGSGGYADTVDFITAHLVGSADFFAVANVPWMHEQYGALASDLRSCGVDMSRDYYSFCGGYSIEPMGVLTPIRVSRGSASATKLAILQGSDVSGNDYLTEFLTFRSGETMIFGGAPTHGAFGGVLSMARYAGEMSGGSVQISDAIFLQASADAHTNFTTGVGIAPDVEVWQKQSDAVAGVDTLVEAARAWLLTGVLP